MTYGPDRKLAVVGVNHAILVAGNVAAATISSAASVSALRAVLAKEPAPIERTLADYAKENALKPRGELFITRKVSVHTDSQMRKTAAIAGNEKILQAEEVTHVPVVAMLFGYFKHEKDIDFEVRDPSDKLVATLTRPFQVRDKERVTFVGADIPILPKVGGRYEVSVKLADKEVARTDVWLELAGDDEQPIEDEDLDDAEDGQPRVDIVVASGGTDDPLLLSGIRSAWSEYHYPRRVNFTWFARGTRGWSGTNVAISAFVLDDKEQIVGRGVGCIRPSSAPSRAGAASVRGLPLVEKAGPYDVVFTLNDHPVAIWPMEAMLREGTSEGGALDRWLKELRKPSTIKRVARQALSGPRWGSGGVLRTHPEPVRRAARRVERDVIRRRIRGSKLALDGPKPSWPGGTPDGGNRASRTARSAALLVGDAPVLEGYRIQRDAIARSFGPLRSEGRRTPLSVSSCLHSAGRFQSGLARDLEHVVVAAARRGVVHADAIGDRAASVVRVRAEELDVAREALDGADDLRVRELRAAVAHGARAEERVGRSTARTRAGSMSSSRGGPPGRCPT